MEEAKVEDIDGEQKSAPQEEDVEEVGDIDDDDDDENILASKPKH